MNVCWRWRRSDTMTEAEKERLYELSLKTGYGYRKSGEPPGVVEVVGGAMTWDEEAEEFWAIYGLPINATELSHDIEEAANVTNMNFRASGAVRVTKPFDLPGLSSGCGCSGPVFYG